MCGEDGAVFCDFKPARLEETETDRQQISCPDVAAKISSDWPDMRGPFGTLNANRELTDSPPSCAWEHLLPGVLSIGAPTCADGLLCVGTQTAGRSDECAVNGLDAASGKLRWRTEVDAGVCGGVLLSNGRGYCGTTAGSLYCINCEDGSVIWRWNNRENLPIACEPFLDREGILHFGANWEGYAVEAETGETVWRKLLAPMGSISYFSPGNSGPIVLGDRVFHQRNFNGGPAGFSSLVQAVDRKTGYNLEHSEAENFPGNRHSSLLVWEDSIVALGTKLYVYDPSDLKS
ncbi:MAG: PQQ-binding-like beta-propeller repeat protein [Candidatus Brocadiia bacterium]